VKLTKEELADKIQECLEVAIEEISQDNVYAVVFDNVHKSLQLLKRLQEAHRLANEVEA